MTAYGDLAGVAAMAGHPRGGWLSGWRRLRDRLSARPAFQRWAASFPLTRPVAARRASALFDLCAGFVYSQILLACVRLRVFELLADGPLSSAVLASRAGLDAEMAERLLRAAAALDLVEARGGGWGLGPLGAVLPGNEALAAMIEHHALVYLDLADPVALLRKEQTTRLAAYWGYAGAADRDALDAGRVEGYTRLMATSQSLVRDDVLDALPMGRVRWLLDVGGGDGSFAIAAAQRWPDLRVTVFDLPAVVEIARQRIDEAGLAGRVAAVGGDFTRDALPQGADLISFVRVLHDHDEPVVRRVLEAARAAAMPGARIVVAEPMAAAPGARRVGDAYFAFYLLAMGTGRARSVAEITALLSDAGLVAVRERRTRRPLQTSLVEATVTQSV